MGLYTPLSAPAKAVDTSLGQRIDALLTNTDAVALNSLAEIVAAFQAADGTLNGAITLLSASASSALSDEAAARADADALLLPKAGGTMTGKLIAAADSGGAKLNVGPSLGAAPSGYASGDLWAQGNRLTLATGPSTSVPLAGINQSNVFSQAQGIDANHDTSPALMITQRGLGDALRVADQYGDPTPFRVTADGRVAVGVAAGAELDTALTVDSTGIKFSDGTIQTVAFTDQRAVAAVDAVIISHGTFADLETLVIVTAEHNQTLIENTSTAAEAQTTANNAQNTANDASSHAANAEQLATSAQGTADTALSSANDAASAAFSAQSAAIDAQSAANDSRGVADSAVVAAAAAQERADTALQWPSGVGDGAITVFVSSLVRAESAADAKSVLEITDGDATTYSDTAPTTPSAGDRWVDTNTFDEYSFYSGAWVQL
jgi:hypothetical protein